MLPLYKSDAADGGYLSSETLWTSRWAERLRLGNVLQVQFLRQEGKGAACAVCGKPYSTGTFHEAKFPPDAERDKGNQDLAVRAQQQFHWKRGL